MCEWAEGTATPVGVEVRTLVFCLKKAFESTTTFSDRLKISFASSIISHTPHVVGSFRPNRTG